MAPRWGVGDTGGRDLEQGHAMCWQRDHVGCKVLHLRLCLSVGHHQDPHRPPLVRDRQPGKRQRLWKKALLEGAAGIFERGGQAAATAEISEDPVRDLDAKIGELAVTNEFLLRKLKPWIGK